MSEQPYSQAALRALIESFTHPIVVVTAPDHLWVANAAYFRLVGLPREQVEGQDFLNFVNPEERSRIGARLRLFFDGQTSLTSKAIRRLIPSADGRMHDVSTYSQEIKLEDGARGLLINIHEMPDRPPVLTIAERLVETSAKLVSAHSAEDVRRVALEGLSSAGFRASFLSWDGRMMSSSAREVPRTDAALAVEALSEGRAIYGGTDAIEASHVYLPLGDARHGVLWVDGPGLDPAHGSALALFAKVVGTALSEARVQAERTRDQWELQALAEVARFVAQPVPPSPESFLERLTALLSADAALLLLQEKPQAALAPLAQFGLPPEELGKKLALSLGQVLCDAAMKSERGKLSGPAEEQALREGSGGQFGCGAAVRITRGGQVCGTLQLLRAPGKPFQVQDLRLMSTLVELLVTLLEQHRLRAESARQLSETKLLLDLARTTAGVLDPAGILDVASDFLVRLLDVSNCYILLYEESNKVLRGAASSAKHRDFFRSVTIPLDGDSLSAHVARHRRPIAIEDLEMTPGGYNDELARRFEEKAILGLPMTSRDELIGVVIVDDTRGPRMFGPGIIELAEATCGQLALSIANARLYESLWMSYAELAAARAEMVKRERLAALGELSAIVAHEVRNPLGVINNAVTTLRRLLHVQGDAAMLLDILSEESDRLNRIVADLIDYARPRDPILQPEEVSRVLYDALEAARGLAGPGAMAVTFRVEAEPDLPPLHIDRRQIRQALVNMAVNAIHAMPQGGEVKVSARREPHDNRDHVRIDISDKGMGIPPELLHRVFEPFFTTKAQGTGLGLAVVRRILEEHRGDISVESAPGRGTTFTIRLPFLPPSLQ